MSVKNLTRQEMQAHLQSVLKQFDQNPASLTRHERRLADKYKKASEACQKLLSDANSLQEQINQAQARLRSIELQAENAQGSASAFADELVALKFDVDDEPKKEPEQVPEKPQEQPAPGKAEAA